MSEWIKWVSREDVQKYVNANGYFASDVDWDLFQEVNLTGRYIRPIVANTMEYNKWIRDHDGKLITKLYVNIEEFDATNLFSIVPADNIAAFLTEEAALLHKLTWER
jgi:hypothetical protein